MKRLQQGIWFLVLVLMLASSLGLGWFSQALNGYAYGFWYDKLAIGEHIDRFAPQNRYIRGFEQTSEQERLDAFAAIARAVHEQGKGLEDIRFSTAQGERRLLRKPEVQHLQDVAALIDVLTLATTVATVLALLGFTVLTNRRIYPAWRVQGGWLLGVAVFSAAVLLLIGPKQVFYQLHVWIFPEGHQWFFYYQDSLMSTLMKAPDLFGGIALAIAAVGITIYALWLGVIVWLQRRAA